MKEFVLGISIAINVMLIVLIVVFLNLPTRFTTCDRQGECYEMDLTYRAYIFNKD